jgi:hypothetical protein
LSISSDDGAFTNEMEMLIWSERAWLAWRERPPQGTPNAIDLLDPA